MISSEIPDWTRESKPFWKWHPAKSLLATIRSYQRVRNSYYPWDVAIKMIVVLQYRFWSAITGADIPLNCNIGGGLLLPHPNGVVIHPGVDIGPNCLIFQQVTIGSVDSGGVPSIAGHVDIGAGAKILGNVKIGAHAKVGANAVVLADVPCGRVAVGIPAKIVGD